MTPNRPLAMVSPDHEPMERLASSMRGEPLEAAAARKVAKEVGVAVDPASVAYGM
ncbi:hypothetical protein GPECTOR_23g63 [Gonium pectorale]|uniref:Uncharacterized protein n=1 Tax=Gonium pectorale TaxID=33097 RepID=A0A150GHN3_GONPE|nr:hypothetical protein GPECTOR_23g63 [Gonium pectorale]|eukprot:KXZ49135.1 hypothetical protein GPECTOR_23g63 [Gonium pectorale]